ncbi:MAG: protein-L-isoaspartate(D-aspartate) O-methyltransferase [Pseudomonadota bacterium]
MTDFAAEREAMVERQLKRRGISDPLILDAFLAIPREAFVESELAHLAYGDHPLPIAAGQTVSQPFIIAEMIMEADVRPGAQVLEVGAGSGYAAAVIARIADRVIAIERQSELVATAREQLARLGIANVEIVEGDGSEGWHAEAPFDAILVAASGSHVPPPLIEQLAPGGRLVMPVGGPGEVQQLVKVTRAEDGTAREETLCAVRFVPLIGVQGWELDDD